MTSEEVARRREQDLNRDRNAYEGMTPAEERRARYAREAYEEAGYHANYGAAAH